MIYWKQHKNIVAATTMRNPHKKENNNMALHCGGNHKDIIENRSALAQKLDLSLAQFVFANQTHSDHIHKVTKADAGRGALSTQDAIADCDALYTREKNLLIGVFTADCVAILLHDPMEGIIAAIHSGWVGTTKQITTKTLNMLVEQERCDPKNIEAFISVAIAFHSFEVGMEVIEQMRQLPFDTTPYIAIKNSEKGLVDNQGLNVQMLLNAGVLPEHITVDKNDTFSLNESFFSYRRDHACGRHLSFIVQS